MIKKCSFDKGKKGCSALACFSNEKCNARDKNNQPRYIDEEISNDKKDNS